MQAIRFATEMGYNLYHTSIGMYQFKLWFLSHFCCLRWSLRRIGNKVWSIPTKKLWFISWSFQRKKAWESDFFQSHFWSYFKISFFEIIKLWILATIGDFYQNRNFDWASPKNRSFEISDDWITDYWFFSFFDRLFWVALKGPKSKSDLLGGGVFGNSLGAFRDGVLEGTKAVTKYTASK